MLLLMKVETPAEQLYFVTLRIETEAGNDRRVATGFIVRHTWGEDRVGLFLVTNKHVVNGAQRGRFSFLKSDGTAPLLGQKYDIEIDDFQNHWFGNPDPEIDIAVLPLGPVLIETQSRQWQIYFKTVSKEILPSKAQLEDLDAIEEVVFIGYPIGIWDTKNFLPIARRGTTATPISVDYANRPIFLVDASVFPGSSGSPVFVCNVGSYSHRGGLVVGSRLLFLGIVSSVFFHEENGPLTLANIPTASISTVKTRQMIDLAVVFKSSAVFETIEALLRQAGELK
jgi:hypothetical protein